MTSLEDSGLPFISRPPAAAMFSISRHPDSAEPEEHRRMDIHRRKSSSRVPRLERRNALRNIDYEAVAAGASWASTSSYDSSAAAGLRSRSLDPSPTYYSSQKSIRIEGVDGEVDLLCRSLGLSGPEDFAISTTAWEARKALSSSLPICSSCDTSPDETESAPLQAEHQETGRDKAKLKGNRPPSVLSHHPLRVVNRLPTLSTRSLSSNSLLAPPPSMLTPVIDNGSSTWDLVKSFAPQNDGQGSKHIAPDSKEDVRKVSGVVDEQGRVGETAKNLTGSTSFRATTDDQKSSATTQAILGVSPNGRFKRSIRSWMRGGLLGSGSFGMVYEAISDDGFFFAVKEVSLLDQGSNAKQCIVQLEQEIALLSQFEHENIVQYFGTDKEEAKLYIFLELVTQGSLASLYHKYNLRDSQVSAYARQILNGLCYLHERNVVHRDIKCANILVDASGSVKLADFGLAKEINKLNMLKSCKGSVYWMAPEVVNPKQTYGPAADIWSLGCTVLEMLTRQIPYPNLEWTQALFRIGRGEPPLIPSSLSKDACDFIGKCVQIIPEDRPSALELLEHPFLRRPPPSPAGSDISWHQHDRR